MDDINEKVGKLETLVANHSDSIKDINCKIKDMESNYDAMDRRLIIVEQNISSINANTTEIKNDLKDLARKREEDHYIKPIERTASYKDKVVMTVITGIIAFALGIILPNLVK
ncbi:MAG: hypothetical protein E7J43_00280 [Finegoldia magna]|nr:hypothetical protein [Finegoldia magna]